MVSMKKENLWLSYQDEDKKEMNRICEWYKKCLDEGKTERECTELVVKMAKEQGLSLNPTKISGICGRLMCCLKYEQETYEELLKVTPRQGALVETPDGKGTVEYVEILKGRVKVRIEYENETSVGEYNVSDIKILKKGKNRQDDEKNDEEMLKALED